MKMPIPDRAVIGRRAAIAADLARLLPADAVIEHEDERRVYETDGLTAYRAIAAAGRAAAHHGGGRRGPALLPRPRSIKVVPRGAGTSLSGGALPLDDGMLLGMARFNRILEIDYDNRCAVVQPGVTNLAITDAVQGERLLLRARSRRARSPAPSAAMSRRIPAACIA